MKDPLNILDSIKKVDAPVFLYAKIVYKISQKKINTISNKEMIYLAIPCVVILVFVILTYVNFNTPRESIEIAKGLNLMNNNSLY